MIPSPASGAVMCAFNRADGTLDYPCEETGCPSAGMSNDAQVTLCGAMLECNDLTVGSELSGYGAGERSLLCTGV